MTNKNIRVSARTAELQAGDDAESGYTFHGVAVGEGDILHTGDGTPVYFGPEELESAARTQEGEPLSVDHPDDENGDPVYPPPVDESPGKVLTAKYVPGKGLAYEANTHEEEYAKGIQAGNYEVSVHPTFDLGEWDDEVQAYRPKNLEFLDLSLVSKGMSPSNTAEWGPSQELVAWTQNELPNELTADSDGPTIESEEEAVGWFRRLAEKAGITASAEEEEVNEPAESGADEEESTNMGDETPEDETEDETEEEQTEEEPQTLGDMTVDELGSALEEQGFATKEDVSELVAQEQKKETKSDKVDEIIARSAEYEEDDREDLMASADTVVDKTHKQVTAQTSASLPGMTSTKERITANARGEKDLDEFGTGVQE